MFNRATNTQKAQVSTALSMPAPTGGLNDLDPLSNMGPEFMIDCLDVFPDTGVVRARPGYMVAQDGFDEAVKSIVSYNNQSGGHMVFACTDDGIWDITTPGTKVFKYALTNGNVDFLNFTNAAGNYLVVWNGTDPAAFYDGTTWAPFVTAGSPSAPGEISGIAPTDISWAFVHMARLWFVKKNSMELFYLPIDQLGGAAAPMVIASNFTRGGYLLVGSSWSSDTGRGISNRLILFSSEGEIASFLGTDPDDVGTWGLDAMFYLAQPLGTRAIERFGGDILVMSRRGVVPVSALLYGTATEVMQAGTLTSRINRAIHRLTENWGAAPMPPELAAHPSPMWITINLWDFVQSRPIQYVMNIATGAWGKFAYPVRTLVTVGDTTYMGTEDGRVLVVTPNLYQDEVDTSGQNGIPIFPYIFSAYTYLGNPTVNKHTKLIQPVINSPTRPAFAVRVLPDFRTDQYDPVLSLPTAGGSAGLWDVAEWDVGTWPMADIVWSLWRNANTLGYSFAWQMKASTQVNFEVAAVKYVVEGGGLV